MGGAANHLVSVLLYLTLYACFPLAPVFLAAGWRRRIKEYGSTPQDILFARVIPVLMLVFFTYNLFPVTLFMRTYFCLMDLYAAAELAEWRCEGRGKRIAVLLLTALLVGRGAYCVCAMAERHAAEDMTEMILSAPDENWERTLILVNGFFLVNRQDELTAPREIGIEDPVFGQDEALELQPGTLVITGTQDFSRCNHYFFPINHELAREMIRRWDVFKRVNEPYYVGQAYPTAYYYLFGYWIKGTTGTDYEFPSNRVYYRG